MKGSRHDSPTSRKPAAQFVTVGERSSSDMSSMSSVSNTAQDTTHRTARANVSITAIAEKTPLTTSIMANHQSPSANRKTQQTPILDEDSPDQVDKLTSYLHETLTLTNENSPANLNHKTSMEVKIPTSVHEGQQDLVLHLKSQLEAAKSEIARRDKELSQHKTFAEHAVDPSSGSSGSLQHEHVAPRATGPPPGFPGHAIRNPTTDRYPSIDRPSTMSPAPVDRFQGPWGNGIGFESAGFGGISQQQFNPSGWNSSGTSVWSYNESRLGFGPSSRYPPAPQPQRPHNLRLDTLESEASYASSAFEHGYRRTSMPNTRPGSAAGPPYSTFNNYSASPALGFSPPVTPMPLNHLNGQPQPQFRYLSPLGSPLSPTAEEFNGHAGVNNSHQANPWNNQTGHESTYTFVPPMEPMNYKRLLERNMSCNWTYVVDKIVLHNDQQASIFLQQKLKNATSEQKHELIEAIVKKAFDLMINRFGNFLIQRCFEHGSPEQVIAIAKAIQGNVLALSMDAFGCHVVQKAFDVVPDNFKARMVLELLRNIPETVIHRYACHVWQKLFELRWAESPPQIMQYVNEALRGMWHEVALGETGSLVVQNIFENCLEEDKRPCINEVLASIDIVSHGQFGNWCIQHICEHGAPADKNRAIEHVLHFATEYSTDQFASKVVEKCLKVGGAEFLERYLERVCEARNDRPRMPLIDIAGDQYGNYLVQYILIHANPQHREIVANHVRKHMVSLRGSKFGSRVAMLCCNPASATRPGPPTGMQMNNRFPPSMPMAFPRSNLPGAYR